MPNAAQTLSIQCFTRLLNHLQFVSSHMKTNVCVHCVAAPQSFGGIFDTKHLLFCTVWINEENRCFCKIFAVTHCFTLLSSHLHCPVFRFVLVTSVNLFLYLWLRLFFSLSPSVQVYEKLLYFVYKKNLGKLAFVKMKKKIKFVLFYDTPLLPGWLSL